MVSLDLELKRTDIHEYSQEANAGQKRLVRAEAEIIEVWYRRLGWHIGNIPKRGGMKVKILTEY